MNKLYNEYQIANFERIININFEDQQLIVEALIHPSYVQTDDRVKHNQRLEFLGDAVLSFIISDYLYRHNPHNFEGDMSKEKAKIVSAYTLAQTAKTLKIDKFLILGKGEERQNIRENIMADAYEAVIGAIYLDQNIYFAEQFIKKTLITTYEKVKYNIELQDYKTKFQEVMQKNGQQIINYETIEVGQNNFVSKLKVGSIIYGEGYGSSKKRAEQQAAYNAIEKENK